MKTLDETHKFARYRSSAEVFDLVVAFENCTLPREDLTDAARVTIVFWHLFMNPERTAVRLIRDGIRRYNFEHNVTASEALAAEHSLLNRSLLSAVRNHIEQTRELISFVDRVNELFRYLGNRRFDDREVLASLVVRRQYAAGSEAMNSVEMPVAELKPERKRLVL